MQTIPSAYGQGWADWWNRITSGGGGDQPAPSPEDVEAELRRYGITPLGGGAVQLPNGQRISESAAFDMIDGYTDATGKYHPPVAIEAAKPPATTAGDTTPTTDGAGVPYIIRGGLAYDLNGNRYDPVPTRSGSTGALTAAQGLEAAARNAALQETIRMNTATMERYGRQDALAAQQQAWLEQKEQLARADRKEELAQTTANQLAGLGLQREQLQLSMRTAEQQALQAQRVLDFNVAQANQQGAQHNAEFNATQGLATQRANDEAEAAKRRDIADVNEKIGVLGQDTGNRGRWASFVTANRGWGMDNTALGKGTSFIDSTSVQPLEGSLANKAAIEARPDRPYSFTPIAFNPIALSSAPGPLTAAGAPAAPGVPAAAAPAAAAPAAANPYAAINAIAQAQAAAGTNTAGFNAAGNAAPGVGAFEHGGVAQGAFMAGDSSDGKENAEIVIPLGAGGAMIVSTRGMSPDKIKSLKRGMVKFATGGLFDQLGDDAKLSKAHLTDASRKFREGTPWAGQPGALPSPVYGSSPGFSPLLNSLLASGRALEQGVPVEYSQWLTNRYKPATISEIGGVGRSG